MLVFALTHCSSMDGAREGSRSVSAVVESSTAAQDEVEEGTSGATTLPRLPHSPRLSAAGNSTRTVARFKSEAMNKRVEKKRVGMRDTEVKQCFVKRV